MNKKIKAILFGDLTWGRFLKSLPFIYVCIAIFAYFYSEKMIFQNNPSSYKENNFDGLLKIKVSGDQFICAKYFPCPAAKYTILMSHGNSEDIGETEDVAVNFVKHGFSVLTYDYRGYGLSSGKSSEKNACQDVMAAYSYLVDDTKVPPENIIAYGRSLGGAFALEVASKKKVGGVILESAFATAFTVLLPPVFPFDRMKNINKIGKINCPILIIHGTKDNVVPFSHAGKLFRNAKEPKYFLELKDESHNISENGGEEFWKAVEDFRESIAKGN